MQEELKKALLGCETDIEGAMQRFYGNEAIYINYLKSFVSESTMTQLGEAIETHSWEDAFVAAHALKGLAGNLGFVPLYHTVGELVVQLRAGKYGIVRQLYDQTLVCHDEVVTAIQHGMKD